ncbi:uncharacterized protein LOC129899805 [Solanum dulcamara]|uniref:uncharacterized protein LOC129899805 n=1 Tax=Solanum dulcamara TaxID=45834 RepID=UPI0024854621|nr:uncharacterized protein LOC129899805 [Solanum dulcamara]
MAPFEALYGRGCRLPIVCFKDGDVKPLGVDLMGEQVLLKVSPIKSVIRFGKKGKLSPHYIGLFKILDCVEPMDYRLALPPSLSRVHLVLYVYMLKKYHGDGYYIIKWDSVLLDKDLQYEEKLIAILDHDVWKLRSKEIKSVKVQWKHHPVDEATWETKKDMRDQEQAKRLRKRKAQVP